MTNTAARGQTLGLGDQPCGSATTAAARGLTLKLGGVGQALWLGDNDNGLKTNFLCVRC